MITIRINIKVMCLIIVVIKVLNPMEKIGEEKKEIITKVEEVLEGIYNQEIDTGDYIPFMEKYNENIETKVASDPDFKFEFKSTDNN